MSDEDETPDCPQCGQSDKVEWYSGKATARIKVLKIPFRKQIDAWDCNRCNILF